MHRICAGCKRLAQTSSIRRVTRALAINNVRRDRQDRLGMYGVAVSWVLSQLAHESCHQPGSQLIDAIVIVAKLWEVAFDLIVSNQTSLIANHANSRVTNCRQTVGHDRQSSDTERHRSEQRIVVQRHFES